MTHRSLFASGVVAIALALPVAASAQHGGPIEVPPVPSILTVPDGHVVYMQTRAYGTQNYFCLNGTWKFFGPQATLYPQNAPIQLATHFLSPNPGEGGKPRPTWQHANDGSTVWGRVYMPTPTTPASSTDPNYVASGAIAWLLVEVAGAAQGPIGGAMLENTTFIHRVNTEGGVAPARAPEPEPGCTEGAIALVPYSTDYFFYRAEKK